MEFISMLSIGQIFRRPSYTIIMKTSHDIIEDLFLSAAIRRIRKVRTLIVKGEVVAIAGSRVTKYRLIKKLKGGRRENN